LADRDKGATGELRKLLNQHSGVRHMVASRLLENAPERGRLQQQVIGSGDTFRMADDAGMVVTHDAEHAATYTQHLAFDRKMGFPYPRAFADDIFCVRIDFLQHVMQLTGYKGNGAIVVERYAYTIG
jgi:hypothetical protein